MITASESETATTKHVLVVDDDDDFRAEIADAIAESAVGWEVTRASTPDEGLKLLKVDKHIDCIFLDLDFPGPKSGIDFLRHIRDFFLTTPIYIMTNYPKTANTLRSYHTTSEEIEALGAIDWFEKNKLPDFQHINTLLLYHQKYIHSFTANMQKDLRLCLTGYVPEIVHESIAIHTMYTSASPFSPLALTNSISRLISSASLLNDRLYKLGSALYGEIYSLPSSLPNGPVEYSSHAQHAGPLDQLYSFATNKPENAQHLAQFRALLSEFLSGKLKDCDNDQRFFLILDLIDRLSSAERFSFLEITALAAGQYFADQKQLDLAGAAVHSAAQRVQTEEFSDMSLNLERIALGYAQKSAILR